MPVAFTWKVLEAIRKQSYIKNRLESSQMDPVQAQHILSPLWHARPVLWAGAAGLGQPTALLALPIMDSSQASALHVRSLSSA